MENNGTFMHFIIGITTKNSLYENFKNSHGLFSKRIYEILKLFTGQKHNPWDGGKIFSIPPGMKGGTQ